MNLSILSPWVAKAIKLLDSRPTDPDLLLIKQVCEINKHILELKPSIDLADCKAFLSYCHHVFAFYNIFCAIPPLGIDSDDGYPADAAAQLTLLQEKHPRELPADETSRLGYDSLTNAAIAAVSALHYGTENDSVESATHALDAIATAQQEKAARSVAEFYNFNTLVDDILFWSHFKRAMVRMQKYMHAPTPAWKTQIPNDYQYCLKLRPAYMPTYHRLVTFYTVIAEDFRSGYNVCLDAEDKAGASATNWDNYELAKSMVDLAMLGAGSADGTMRVGHVRALVRRAKLYFEIIKDWMPEELKCAGEEQFDFYGTYPPADMPDEAKMPGIDISGTGPLEMNLYGGVPNMCNGCGKKSDIKLLKCSGCEAVYYCGKECQKKDWKGGHNVVCRRKK
jgi:hypothetical protein